MILIIICVILSITVFKSRTIADTQPQEVCIDQISEYTETRYSDYLFLKTDIGDYYYACPNNTRFTQGLKRLNELAEQNECLVVYAYYDFYPNFIDSLIVNGYQRIVEIHYNDEVIFSIDEFNDYLAGDRLTMIIIIVLLCFFMVITIYSY